VTRGTDGTCGTQQRGVCVYGQCMAKCACVCDVVV